MAKTSDVSHRGPQHQEKSISRSSGVRPVALSAHFVFHPPSPLKEGWHLVPLSAKTKSPQLGPSIW